MKQKVLIFLLTVFLTMEAIPCFAMQLYLPFDRIVQKADVVFLGTVKDQQCRYGPNGKMIFTDVYFELTRLIFSSKTAQSITGDEIVLTFAGGEIDGMVVRVSDVPFFETGRTYLIFTYMDGKPYGSPIVGASQGLFEVLTDEITGISHILTYGKRPIVSIENGDLRVGPPIRNIRGGSMEKIPVTFVGNYYEVAPQPVGGDSEARASVAPLNPQKMSMPDKIKSLDEFIDEIAERIRMRREE
jgi:hypothetical protein